MTTGQHTDAQAHIQTLLNQLVSDGRERGIQVAAYIEGQLAVHAWAGVADADSGRLVDAGTLFPIFSTSKGITATLVHLLAERGQLDYDQAITSLWPEFAANGKENVTIRQALTHASGIPQVPRVAGFAELCDWDTMCAEVAALTPLWEPGTRMEYHAITYGWILGEVLRRCDGRAFPELLREEICQPLGMDHLYVGLPAQVETRVAVLEEPGVVVPPAGEGQPEAIPAWLGPLHVMMNRSDVRRACMPASNGIASALSVARHYAALLPGGVDGVELLSPERVHLATTLQKPDFAVGDDYPRCWGLGYMIGHPGFLFGDAPTSFGHPGYGGSFGFADLHGNIAVGLTKNLFTQEDTPRLIVSELRRVLAS